jgi:hypothetical protein
VFSTDQTTPPRKSRLSLIKQAHPQVTSGTSADVLRYRLRSESSMARTTKLAKGPFAMSRRGGPKPEDLTGRRFGRLIAVSVASGNLELRLAPLAQGILLAVARPERPFGSPEAR